jgi:hypothetical protein
LSLLVLAILPWVDVEGMLEVELEDPCPFLADMLGFIAPVTLMKEVTVGWLDALRV